MTFLYHFSRAYSRASWPSLFSLTVSSLCCFLHIAFLLEPMNILLNDLHLILENVPTLHVTYHYYRHSLFTCIYNVVTNLEVDEWSLPQI